MIFNQNSLDFAPNNFENFENFRHETYVMDKCLENLITFWNFNIFAIRFLIRLEYKVSEISRVGY
jgi:hypothetical protein